MGFLHVSTHSEASGAAVSEEDNESAQMLLLALFMWAAQTAVDEVGEACTSARLWFADPTLNVLELVGPLGAAAGLGLQAILWYAYVPEPVPPEQAHEALSGELLFPEPPARQLRASAEAHHESSSRGAAMRQVLVNDTRRAPGADGGLVHLDGSDLRDDLFEASRALIAVGIFVMWTSQALRLLQRSSSLGPYVHMAVSTLNDVRRFLLIITGAIVGFAGAFTTLFRGGGVDDMCSAFDGREDVPGGGFFASTLTLYQVMLGGIAPDAVYQCLAVSTYPISSIGLMSVYLVVIVLMMLNMLIAMMTASFESVRSHRTLNYHALSASAVAVWCDAPAPPALLRLLSLPYYAVRALKRAWLCLKPASEAASACLDGGQNGDVDPPSTLRPKRLASAGRTGTYRRLKVDVGDDTGSPGHAAAAADPKAERERADDEHEFSARLAAELPGLTTLLATVDHFMANEGLHFMPQSVVYETLQDARMRQTWDELRGEVQNGIDKQDDAKEDMDRMAKEVGGVKKEVGLVRGQMAALADKLDSIHNLVNTAPSSTAQRPDKPE